MYHLIERITSSYTCTKDKLFTEEERVLIAAIAQIASPSDSTEVVVKDFLDSPKYWLYAKDRVIMGSVAALLSNSFNTRTMKPGAVSSLLDISTAHISGKDNKKLIEVFEDNTFLLMTDITLVPIDMGYILTCNPDEQLNPDNFYVLRKCLNQAGFSPALSNIYLLATLLGCSTVRIDRDGFNWIQLKTYNW